MNELNSLLGKSIMIALCIYNKLLNNMKEKFGRRASTHIDCLAKEECEGIF